MFTQRHSLLSWDNSKKSLVGNLRRGIFALIRKSRILVSVLRLPESQQYNKNIYPLILCSVIMSEMSCGLFKMAKYIY